MSVELGWTSRYSDTMESDDRGRWARILYGKNTALEPHPSLPHPNSIRQLAWVTRKENAFHGEGVGEEPFVYLISLFFPTGGGDNGLGGPLATHAFTLREAMALAEAAWRDFEAFVRA